MSQSNHESCRLQEGSTGRRLSVPKTWLHSLVPCEGPWASGPPAIDKAALYSISKRILHDQHLSAGPGSRNQTCVQEVRITTVGGCTVYRKNNFLYDCPKLNEI